MSNNSMLLGIAEDDLLNCIQCGYCLPACPTYQIEQKETATPRGRLALMKGVQDGKLEIKNLTPSIEVCLGCRACEAACPSGVNYGHILEQAKDVIASQTKYSLPVRMIRNLMLRKLLPFPQRMRFIRGGIHLYQKLGLQKIARKTGLLKIMPWQMATFESVLPEVAPMSAKLPTKVVGSTNQNKISGKKLPTIGLFTGCIQETIYHETNKNTLKLLKAAGFTVVVPDEQTCCGAIHAHAGEKEQAKELARKNIAMAERIKVDYLVNNQGGCGAMLKEYDHLLANDPDWSDRAKEFVKKVKDINEILVMLEELPRLKEIKETVTYQDSCHLLNVQGVKFQPRQMIQAIPGIVYRELEGAGSCCGSAGTYNITQYNSSMQILDEKMQKVQDTNATIIVTANPGCLLQMQIGIKRAGLTGKVRAIHIVDLLAEALADSLEL